MTAFIVALLVTMAGARAQNVGPISGPLTFSSQMKYGSGVVGLNLGQANVWTAQQTFSGGIGATQLNGALNLNGQTISGSGTFSGAITFSASISAPLGIAGTPSNSYLDVHVGSTSSPNNVIRTIGYQAASEWENQAGETSSPGAANFFCGVDDSGGPSPASSGTNFGCGPGANFANENVPFWLYDTYTDTIIWNRQHTVKIPYGSGSPAADGFDLYNNSDGNTFGVIFENNKSGSVASGNYVWFSQFCNNPGSGTTCGDNGPSFNNGRDQITIGALLSGGTIASPSPCVDGSHYDFVTTEQYGTGTAQVTDINAKITLITNNNGSACSSTENGMDMQVWLTPHGEPQSDITKVLTLNTTSLALTLGADSTALWTEDASLTHYNLISLNGSNTYTGAIGILGGATGDDGLYALLPNGTSATSALTVMAAGTPVQKLYGSGDSMLSGKSSANLTTATSPFTYIGASAGRPTGVPAFESAGQIAIVIDTTDNEVCFYTSAWKCASGS